MIVLHNFIVAFFQILIGLSSARRSFLNDSSVAIIVLAAYYLILMFLIAIPLSSLLFRKISKQPNKTIGYSFYIFLSSVNYIEISMYSLSIHFVNINHECSCLSHLQWQAGIIAVFLAWLDLLTYFELWPALGIYIGMLKTIAKRFLSAAILAIVLLLAFSFAFFMAFHNPEFEVSVVITMY